MAEQAEETFQQENAGGDPFQQGAGGESGGGENSQPPPITKEGLPIEVIYVVVAGFVFALVAILYLYWDKQKRTRKEGRRRLDRLAVRSLVLETEIPAIENPKRLNIISRDDQIQTILSALSRDFSRTLITAPPGSGKSTLIDLIGSSKEDILRTISAANQAGVAKIPVSTWSIVRANNEFQLKRDLFGIVLTVGLRFLKIELSELEKKLEAEKGNRATLEKRRMELIQTINEFTRLQQNGYDEQHLLRLLPNMARFGDWLLFIVGVEDPSLLQPLNFLKSGRIIVTSSLKQADFASSFQFNGIFELPPLTPEGCLSLFEAQNSTLGGIDKLSNDEKEDLLTIFERMGRLPIAVKIIAQVAESCIPYQELIEACKTNSWTLNDLIDHLYFNILILQNPAFALARKMLEYCSFLSPFGIPEILFRQEETFLTQIENQAPADIFDGYDKYARIEAFSDKTFEISSRILQNLGLILIADGPFKNIMVHPLIQARVRHLVQERENKAFVLRPLVHLMTRNFSDAIYQDQLPWPLMSAVAVNVTELVKHLDGVDKASHLRSLGTFARHTQGLERAEKLLLESKAIFKAMTDQDSLDVALIDNILIGVYTENGDFNKAITSGTSSLQVWKRIGHAPNVIQTLLSLSRTYEAAKKPNEAFKALEETLTLLELKNGKDSEKLLPVLDQLASLKTRNGKNQEAIPYLERGLEIAKGEFGENAPQTFPHYHKLSLAKEAVNDLPNALALAEKAFEVHSNMKERSPNHEAERGFIAKRVAMLKQNTRALQEKIEELESKKGKETATKLNKTELKKALHG